MAANLCALSVSVGGQLPVWDRPHTSESNQHLFLSFSCHPCSRSQPLYNQSYPQKFSLQPGTTSITILLDVLSSIPPPNNFTQAGDGQTITTLDSLVHHPYSQGPPTVHPRSLTISITDLLYGYGSTKPMRSVINTNTHINTQLKIPFLDNQAWVFGANVHKEGERLHGDGC